MLTLTLTAPDGQSQLNLMHERVLCKLNGSHWCFIVQRRCRSVSELRQLQAVKALVECAKLRKGAPASRNAGIAAAKLAKDATCLEQLRECNGLEVIYSYVKP